VAPSQCEGGRTLRATATNVLLFQVISGSRVFVVAQQPRELHADRAECADHRPWAPDGKPVVAQHESSAFFKRPSATLTPLLLAAEPHHWCAQ
jgi:hypothetical protein